MYPELRGRRVLITGASRGIGLSVARAFAAEGSRVFVLAETPQIIEAAALLQQAAACPVTAIQCDVTDRAGLTVKIRAIGPLDVVVANAGTGDITPIDDPSERIDDLFERLVRINLFGAYNTVRAALPLLSAGARIIFTSSVHGQSIAPPQMGGYTASKGGLEALMRTLARELGPRGINVNAVAPGMVATELTLSAIRKLFGAQIGTGTGTGISEDQMIDRLNSGQAIHHTPVSPDYLARSYLFLASDAGSAITGQSLNVDHGLCIN